MWLDVDFAINKMFWRHWGPDIALPIRLRNISDFCDLAEKCGLVPVLVGRGARHLGEARMLLSDHDDDFAFSENLSTLESRLDKPLSALGFETIRRTKDIWSVVRHGRYIDIHPKFIGKTVSMEAHGRTFIAEQYIPAKEPNSDGQKLTGLASRLKQAVNSPRHTLIAILQNLGSVNANQDELVGEISLEEFLSLKFDIPTAINWDWRSDHVRSFAWPGATLGEILAGLDLEALERNLVETPTTSLFKEPINLSREFWKSGNNFFVAPILAGFRHGVMPYSGANIYIATNLKPNLYTLEYYRSLPKVSDDELPRFLKARPIAVKKGSIRSGRHRVATMLGRLARGEKYFPFHAFAESSPP